MTVLSHQRSSGLQVAIGVTWDEETQQWVPVLDRLEGPTS